MEALRLKMLTRMRLTGPKYRGHLEPLCQDAVIYSTLTFRHFKGSSKRAEDGIKGIKGLTLWDDVKKKLNRNN